MSSSFVRSIAAVAAVGVGSLSFIGGPAAAQECYPPTAGCATTTTQAATTRPSITLSSTTLVRGQRVGASVAGFQGGTSGIITIASVEQQIGTFTMPASGAASTTVTIPTNISLGAHTVFARGTVAGAAASASQAVTIVAGGTNVSGNGTGTGTGSSLARTGVYLIPASIIGLGLVAGGVALKRSSKKSKDRVAA